MSAIPATGAVDQARLHSFELDAEPLPVDARPQAEVWVVVVAGALVLPIWAVAALAPVVHVAGLVLRRDRTWRRWRNLVLVAAVGAAATAAAGQVLGALRGDLRVALAGLAAAAVALVLGRLPLLRTTD